MSRKSRSRKLKHGVKLANAILYVARTITDAFKEMKKERHKSIIDHIKDKK